MTVMLSELDVLAHALLWAPPEDIKIQNNADSPTAS